MSPAVNRCGGRSGGLVPLQEIPVLRQIPDNLIPQSGYSRMRSDCAQI